MVILLPAFISSNNFFSILLIYSFTNSNINEYISIRDFFKNVWAIEIDTTHRDYDDNKAILNETLNLMKNQELHQQDLQDKVK